MAAARCKREGNSDAGSLAATIRLHPPVVPEGGNAQFIMDSYNLGVTTNPSGASPPAAASQIDSEDGTEQSTLSGQTTPMSDFQGQLRSPGLDSIDLQQTPPLLLHQTMPIDLVSDAVPRDAACVLEKLEKVASTDHCDRSHAAGNMLQSIYCHNGIPLHATEVTEKMRQVRYMREVIVTQLALRNASCSKWSFEEWKEWYASNDLPVQDFKFALDLWGKIFEYNAMDAKKGRKTSKDRHKGTRESKAVARKGLRDPFCTWLQQTYGHAHLAKSLLKYAAVKINNLVQDWLEYMKTPEYEKVRNRACGQSSAEERRCRNELRKLRKTQRQARAGKEEGSVQNCVVHKTT